MVIVTVMVMAMVMLMMIVMVMAMVMVVLGCDPPPLLPQELDRGPSRRKLVRDAVVLPRVALGSLLFCVKRDVDLQQIDVSSVMLVCSSKMRKRVSTRRRRTSALSCDSSLTPRVARP